MVNITLAADAEVIAKAQAYAQARNTTVEQLVGVYLERLADRVAPVQAAEEFAALARSRPGCSAPGFVFDRSATHQRPGAEAR